LVQFLPHYEHTLLSLAAAVVAVQAAAAVAARVAQL
jgi:hypothetical protein